jgi:regulator of sigma E protease
MGTVGGAKNNRRYNKRILMGINIVSVIVLLGVLIFVHELGHFLVAKLSGVGVLKFSLGFGPKIIGKTVGETEYLVSAVPLGGYVKLLGESEEDEIEPEDEKRSFQRQPVSKRMAIVFAGPLFNFVFAIVVFSVIFGIGVPSLTSTVGGVKEGAAAMIAGIEEGDRILAIDGNKIELWSELADVIGDSEGRGLEFEIERDDKILHIEVVPEKKEGTNIFGEEVDSYQIGISSSQEMMVKRYNPLEAVFQGIGQTWSVTKLVIVGIYKIFEGVVSPRELGGPILIAKMSGEFAKQGLIPFVFFMAFLSINLGVLNLLPIPVLDGGHLMFFLIEAATGKEVNVRWREMAQQVGFFLLIMLMIFVFWNDIVRIFGW